MRGLRRDVQGETVAEMTRAFRSRRCLSRHGLPARHADAEVNGFSGGCRVRRFLKTKLLFRARLQDTLFGARLLRVETKEAARVGISIRQCADFDGQAARDVPGTVIRDGIHACEAATIATLRDDLIIGIRVIHTRIGICRRVGVRCLICRGVRDTTYKRIRASLPGQPPRIVWAERLHLVLEHLHVIRNHTSLAHQRPNAIAVRITFFRNAERLATEIVSKSVMAALMRVDEQMLLRADRSDWPRIVSDDPPARSIDNRSRENTIHCLDADHRATVVIGAGQRHRLRVAAGRKRSGDRNGEESDAVADDRKSHSKH